MLLRLRRVDDDGGELLHVAGVGGRWMPGGERHRVFVDHLDIVGRHGQGQVVESPQPLDIGDPVPGPLDVSRGELVAGGALDSLAELDRPGTAVRCHLPRFGQPWLEVHTEIGRELP